jgi:cyclophilin family peptidyl-prolyl cis-trans isomerase
MTDKTKAKTKPKSNKNQNQKENQKMPPTMTNDEIDFSQAEDFKLPAAGVHNANLAGVEMAVTKKNENKEQFILTVTLSSNDPDAPNLPLRKYLGWPLPEERETFWGSRTAYGAQVQAIKEVMTAFGGQESGATSKSAVLAFLSSKIGMAVKVKVKLEARKDQTTGEPLDPPEFQANVDKLLPA